MESQRFSIKQRANLGGVNWGGDGRYLFIITLSNTVEIYDTNSVSGSAPTARYTLHSTVTLATTSAWAQIVFRAATKQVYLFSSTRVCVIDADPTSATFATEISNTAVTIYSNPLASYDPIRDVFYLIQLAVGTKISVYDPKKLTLTNYETGSAAGFLNSAMGSTNGIWLGYHLQLRCLMICSVNNGPGWGCLLDMNKSGEISIYNAQNNSFATSACNYKGFNYVSNTGGYRRLAADFKRYIYTLTPAATQPTTNSPIVCAPNGIAMNANNAIAPSNYLSFYNLNSDTLLGQFTKADADTGEIGSRNLLYLPYAKKFALLATGTNQSRVHYYDPYATYPSMEWGYQNLSNNHTASQSQTNPQSGSMCVNRINVISDVSV